VNNHGCVHCKRRQEEVHPAAPVPVPPPPPPSQPFSQASLGFGGDAFGQTAFGDSTFGGQQQERERAERERAEAARQQQLAWERARQQQLERERAEAARQQKEREWGEKHRTFYHGTSLEAAENIQKVGFDVTRSGSNAGAMLGRGLYVTSTLEKAINYAKRMPCQGAIFEVQVQLGKCYRVSANDSNMAKWQEMGYDSAWAAAGIFGEREENCIKDPRPPRVKITDVILGHTGEARRAGYSVVNGRLTKK